MPYENTTELPTTIQETLPKAAQEVYIAAYNQAWEAYEEVSSQTLSRESVAHQIAWDTVNREFVHDEKTGQWYRQGEVPAEEAAEDKGLLQKLRDLF